MAQLIGDLTINVDDVKAATKALDDLTAAAERARLALQALGCAVVLAVGDEEEFGEESDELH